MQDNTPQPTETKKVEIYSTPTCHFCVVAKQFFKDHGISYTEYNVATDMMKRQELGVPVVVIGDDVMVGFQEDKFRELLAL
jgi:arsenate reductase-like glutaredoxin family protein